MPVPRNLNQEEMQQVNLWYDSFVKSAKEFGLDLTKKEDMGNLSWFNPVEDEGGTRYDRIPAFVPTRGDDLVSEPSRYVDSMTPDPQWVYDNIQTEVSMEKKAQLYEMARQGRLFLAPPTPDDPNLRQIRVAGDGTAGIMGTSADTPAYGDIEEPKAPAPVAPPQGSEPPMPKEVPAPTGWQRFANLISGGSAYKDVFDQRREFEKGVAARAEWQARSRAHADYVAERHQYDARMSRNRQVRALKERYADHERLTELQHNIQGSVSYRPSVPEPVFRPNPALAGQLKALQEDYRHRGANMASARFWEEKHQELRSRESVEAGGPALTPKNDAGALRLRTDNAVQDIAFALSADNQPGLNRNLAGQYPRMGSVGDLTPEEQEILANGLIAKGSMLRAASLGGGPDATVPVNDVQLRSVIRAEILANMIAAGGEERERFRDPRFRRNLEEVLGQVGFDDPNIKCSDIYNTLLGPKSGEILGDMRDAVAEAVSEDMKQQVTEADFQKLRDVLTPAEQNPAPDQANLGMEISDGKDLLQFAENIRNGKLTREEFLRYAEDMANELSKQKTGPIDPTAAYRFVPVEGTEQYVEKIPVENPGARVARQKQAAKDDLNHAFYVDKGGKIVKSQAPAVTERLYQLAAAALYEAEQEGIRRGHCGADLKWKPRVSEIAKNGDLTPVVNLLKKAKTAGKELASPTLQMVQDFTTNPKAAVAFASKCLFELKPRKEGPANEAVAPGKTVQAPKAETELQI